MTTRIVLEVHSDDPGIVELLSEYNRMDPIAKMEIDAAIHAWEAQRLIRHLGALQGRQDAYGNRRRRSAGKAHE